MSEEGQAVQRQLWERRQLESRPRKSLDGGWNDSTQTIHAEKVKILNKQEAAMKRERALAYAFSHQVCVRFIRSVTIVFVYVTINYLCSLILFSQP